MGLLDKILNVGSDFMPEHSPDRDSALSRVENLEEKIFSHLGRRQYSLGELMDASRNLRNRLDERFPPTPESRSLPAMPKPIALELESLSRSVVNDVAAGRISRSDAEDFERSFLDTLGPDFRGAAPTRLFARTRAGLKPVKANEIMSLQVEDTSPNPPVVWSPPMEEEPISLPDPNRSSRDTFRFPFNIGARVLNNSSSLVFIKTEFLGKEPLHPNQSAWTDGFYQNPPGAPQFADAAPGDVVRKLVNGSEVVIEDSTSGKALAWRHARSSSSIVDQASGIFLPDLKASGWKTAAWIDREEIRWPPQPTLEEYEWERKKYAAKQ